MYYLETKGMVKALIKEVVNELTDRLTFSIKDAIVFDTKKEAKEFIKKNKRENSCKIISIN